MRVMVDIDDCVYPFIDEFKSFSEKRYKIEELPYPEHWDFHVKQWGWTDDEFDHMLEQGYRSGDLYHHGSPIQDSKLYIDKLKGKGFGIHICTARNFIDGLPERTIRWLHDHGIKYDSISFSADKTIMDVDLAVDDHVYNVEALKAKGVKAYIFDQPHNRDYETPDRVFGWEDFYRVVTAKV